MTTPTYTCPHCKREIKNWLGFIRHEPLCVYKPEIDAILRQCLQNPDTGYMKSVIQYEKTRPEGAPSSDTIESQLAPGGWRKLAKIYGLEVTPTGRPRKDGSLPVPSGLRNQVIITGPLPRRIEEGEDYTRQGLLVCDMPTVAQWIVVLNSDVAVKVTEQFWRVR